MKPKCQNCNQWTLSEEHSPKGICSSKKRKEEKGCPLHLDYVTLPDSKCDIGWSEDE